MFGQYFNTPENPDFFVIIFTATEIAYDDKNLSGMVVWKR